jgi:hypothetical protein
MWVIGMFGNHEILSSLVTEIPASRLVELMWRPHPRTGRTMIHALACGGHVTLFELAVDMYVVIILYFTPLPHPLLSCSFFPPCPFIT